MSGKKRVKVGGKGSFSKDKLNNYFMFIIFKLINFLYLYSRLDYTKAVSALS